uniref:Uncharacterized protein n=1 Tax=Oryza sativa subsp. indica TaxID=39946 RepID=C5NNM7_ORYSI|nr:hypothetical protein [Oryza sativa Indica Group]
MIRSKEPLDELYVLVKEVSTLKRKGIIWFWQQRKDFKEISKDDYFAKNKEFATWSKDENGKFFSDLSSESARDLFEKFVKTWKKRKLPSQYSEGITCGPRWVLQIAGEEASMKDRFVSAHRKTANRSHAIKNTVGHQDREHAEIQPSTVHLI